jgi:hypothetical protein
MTTVTTDLFKKLQLKPGARLWLINMPPPFADEIIAGGIKAAKPGTSFDGAIVFCDSPDDVAAHAKRILAGIPQDGLLWFAYRKGKAAKTSGLSRDVGWDALIGGRLGDRALDFVRRHVDRPALSAQQARESEVVKSPTALDEPASVSI